MGAWAIANTLGVKKCTALTQTFRYECIEPDDTPIIIEDERNFVFYLIISGTCVVTRGGAVLGQLGRGKCFGDFMLLNDSDWRHVTVKAQTRSVQDEDDVILYVICMIVPSDMWRFRGMNGWIRTPSFQ